MEIYALYSPEHELKRVGMTLESVTCHLDKTYPAELHNMLMEPSNTPETDKKLLEKHGWEIKEGYFAEKSYCTECQHGEYKISCDLPSLTPCPKGDQ